jgi:hypothetical protein
VIHPAESRSRLCTSRPSFSLCYFFTVALRVERRDVELEWMDGSLRSVMSFSFVVVLFSALGRG